MVDCHLSDIKKMNYLETIYNKVYLDDIINRNKITKTEEFDGIVSVIASSVDSLTNPIKLANTIKTIKN